MLHSRKLAWNLNRAVAKRRGVYTEPLFTFHVRFPECRLQLPLQLLAYELKEGVGSFVQQNGRMKPHEAFAGSFLGSA